METASPITSNDVLCLGNCKTSCEVIRQLHHLLHLLRGNRTSDGGTANAGGRDSGGNNDADDGEGDAGTSTISDKVVICERGMVL
ncbi:hypothetical protein Tco_1492821 [Tanacetum coccineum]